MWHHADRQIDEFVAKGQCEFIKDFAAPFTLYVIADLLGVPESDHEMFRQELQGGHRPAQAVGSTGSGSMGHSPLEFLYERFSSYIEDRRRQPRNDVLTGLAAATFPDGSTPEVIDVVRVAANLFSAGQETTVRLLAAAFQLIGERADLQQLLRDDSGKVPDFVEECLRMESPVKGDFRLSRRATTVGGVEIPAGTTVMVLNGAAGRDPRRFVCPAEFQIDRANARANIWRSGAVRTPAPGVRWRGPRRASVSSGFSLACWTYGSQRRRTARREPGTTSTPRRTFSGASSGCSSSSPRPAEGPYRPRAHGSEPG